MQSQNDIWIPVFLVAVIAIVILAWVWHFSRARSILQKWADDNSYPLLQTEYCWFRRGPFFWTTSRDQAVYYVTVLDQQGHERRGWVRCGSWFFGMFSNQADVRWEERADPTGGHRE
jgi:hypothetical protein